MSARSDRETLDNIHKGVKEGVRKAVREHKRAGRAIAVWNNGKVEHIPPKKIEIKDKD
jgi:hypothetical protein